MKQMWKWTKAKRNRLGVLGNILDDEMNYKRLNNELKCLNVFYEVVSIVATDEEVLSDFEHLIDKNYRA